jgi:hypothetical protein
MSLDLLFTITFPVVVPFWALMILAPWWRRTSTIIRSPLIVVPPLIICLLIMVPRFGEFWTVYSAPSLAGLQTLLASPAGSAAIWAHLITFDLFVGRWIFLDARQRRIPALVTSPLLFFTILVSPVGLAAYLILRYTVGRSARPRVEVTAPASQPVGG